MNHLAIRSIPAIERRYEILVRFLLEGLKVGVTEEVFHFKEWRLHKALPFVLEDLALAHITGLEFERGPDKTYPAIHSALGTMVRSGIITCVVHPDHGNLYAFTEHAIDNLKWTLENHSVLDAAEKAAVREAFPRGLRAFVRDADYDACVAQTGCHLRT